MRFLFWSCALMVPLLVTAGGCNSSHTTGSQEGLKFREIEAKGKAGGKKLGSFEMEDPNYKGPKR